MPSGTPPTTTAAALLHLRQQTLAKGGRWPLPLPLTVAAMFHLPGDPVPAASLDRCRI